MGIGNNEEREWVCAIKSLDSQSIRSVVAGSRNSLAICHDGKVPSFYSIAYSRFLIFTAATIIVNFFVGCRVIGCLIVVYMGLEPKRDTGTPTRDQN